MPSRLPWLRSAAPLRFVRQFFVHNRSVPQRRTLRGARRFWTGLTIALAVVLLFAPPATQAQPRSPERVKAARKFKVGDTVLATWHNRQEEGKVARIFGNGEIQVITRGYPSGWNYDPADLRLVKRAKAAAAANPKVAQEEANPFATDDEKFGEIGQRTWSDRSGKFQIAATVAGLDGTKVVLKRSDGKEITVERSKLSDADQAVLNKIAGPPDEAEASDGIEGEAGDESSLAEVRFFETQLATATPLDLSGASAWQVKPDPLATPRKPARIALPERRDIFDNYESVMIPPGPLAYVIISSRHPNGVATRVVACDLETRKIAKDAEFYLGQVPLDVSPDSRRMVSCGIRWSGDEDATLTLFEIDQFKTTPKFRWQPYAGEWGHYREIEWARFVDADHLATMSRWGQLALWDLARGKPQPVYAGRADIRGARAVFSPGRKYLVVLTGKGISFLDPLDGSSLGYIDTQTQGFASHLGYAISPDGGKLALVDHGRVRTWDLATGEQVRDFTLAEGRSTDQLVWCDDLHLLTGNGDLIDLDRRIVIWKYSGIDSPLWSTGEAVWGISSSRTGEASLLIGAKLPHKEALRAAEALDADALLVIRPGLDVSLRMSFSGSADEQERVRQALTARLEQVGMKVVPQSNVVLSATIRPGEAQKVQYRNFNGGSYTEHSVQTQILELAYLVDNKPVWKHQRQSWTPAVLHLNQGESIQQALSRAMKQDAKTFESIDVPGHVAITPPGWPPTSPWSGG